MDINKILKSDYLDLLFEGRNKSYGGYELRKNYPKRMARALMVLGGIALLIAGYYVAAGIAKNARKEILNMKEVQLAEPPPIDPNKPPPPPPPPVPPPPVKPTVAFTPPIIKKDEEVKEEEKPPPADDERAISTVTQEGDPNGIDPGMVENPGTGVVEAPAAPTIFTYVEQMPEYPGGDEARKDFLRKNLRYPDLARENNITGRVTVRFVVNEDGAITDVNVVKGIGGGCDEEAKRVVEKMPKWKPGKNNGRPAKVYFTLPIMFTLE